MEISGTSFRRDGLVPGEGHGVGQAFSLGGKGVGRCGPGLDVSVNACLVLGVPDGVFRTGVDCALRGVVGLPTQMEGHVGADRAPLECGIPRRCSGVFSSLSAFLCVCWCS